jgi:hypothetical protein
MVKNDPSSLLVALSLISTQTLTRAITCTRVLAQPWSPGGHPPARFFRLLLVFSLTPHLDFPTTDLLPHMDQ